MANSPVHLSFLFLVSLLFFFGPASARDSHFFSKITRENTNANDNANDNANIKEIKGGAKVQEVQVPAKEEPTLNKAKVHVQVQEQEQEQEPSFIPQTNENGGYGLYGHETGLLPPSTTTTTKMATVAWNPPFIPRYERPVSNYNTERNNERFYSIDREAEKKQEEGVDEEDQDAYLYSNAVYYNPEYEGLSGKEFIDNARLGNGEAYNYNLKQGMSDTRFLDNGKYYYDAYSEKNVPKLGYSNYKNVDNVDDSHPGNNRKIDAYFQKNVRTIGYPNYDNEKVNNVIDNGYFDDNEKANAYRFNNGMQGYKNKEEQESTAFGP